MVTRIYADTNIWYGLGSGVLSKAEVVGPNEEQWPTPVNLLEIAGGVKIGNWAGRQAAAAAIIDSSDRIADDPETHLVACLGGAANFEPPNWIDVCKALAGAADITELERGVPDYFEGHRRSVSVDFLAKTKAQHYEDFALKLAAVCDQYVDGYLDAYRRKESAPKLSKQMREQFRSAARSAPFVAAVLTFGIGGRYQLITDMALDLADEGITAVLVNAFTPYGRLYAGYIAALITTGRKPHPNDWGDLELFLYLQDDACVATAEKKWWTIADDARLGPRLRRVSTVSSE